MTKKYLLFMYDGLDNRSGDDGIMGGWKDLVGKYDTYEKALKKYMKHCYDGEQTQGQIVEVENCKVVANLWADNIQNGRKPKTSQSPTYGNYEG